MAWLIRQDHAQASRAADAALAIQPDSPYALYVKAIAGLDTPDVSAERQLFERILELQGALDLRLYSLRTQLLLTEAIRDGELRPDAKLGPILSEFERMIALTEGAAWRLQAAQFAMVMPERSVRDQAMQWLEEAVRLEPDRGEAHMRLGFMKLLRGASKDEVLACWHQARRVEPRIQITADMRHVFRERFGSTEDVDAFLPVAPERDE